MVHLQITYRRVSELHENPANGRSHSPKQVRQIAGSMRSFGFNVPILVDQSGMVVCGHGRLSAAKLLGMESVPTVCLSHLSETQRRAFVIADNRLSELSTWDDQVLAVELEELQGANLDFELIDTGFEIGEIDARISKLHEPDDADTSDEPIDAGRVRAVARRGDLWALGAHRLFCGDALDSLSYRILLGDARAQMVFTDPPFNCRVPGHVSGKGKVKHADFVMASGELSEAQFHSFLEQSLNRMADASVNGSILYVFMDGAHLRALLNAAAEKFELKNVCVWDKGHGGMGSLYRSQTEFVAVLKSGTAPHVNNVLLGRYGRNRTTVWRYPGMNSFQAGRAKILASHPTIKPVGLVADAIMDCSTPGSIILDPFGGSGTTLIAAERTTRRAAVIELDPHYVDVALQRFLDVTGVEPVNLFTGETLPRVGGRPARSRGPC